MTEYNKVETQDGYTKVRTHDFVAIENELTALRAARDELRDALEAFVNNDAAGIVSLNAHKALIDNAAAVLAKYAGE